MPGLKKEISAYVIRLPTKTKQQNYPQQTYEDTINVDIHKIC